jgi:putative flippase GtrA
MPQPTNSISVASASKFGAVGIANTLLSLAVIYACKQLRLGDVSANFIGYACGLVLSFNLNKKWTFRIEGKTRASHIVRFACAFAVSYSANLATVLTLINNFGLNSYLAQLAGMPVYTATFYLLCALGVFRNASDGSRELPLPVAKDAFSSPKR